METFGQRLAHAMDIAGKVKQTDLARMIDCKKATIGQAVNGQTQELRATHSLLAARALSVDPFWLVLGDGEARPKFMAERAALSAKAIYIGRLLDSTPDDAQRERAYALIVQLLEFNDGPPNQR